ncbi:prepilin-type N-terminal cleavage/methylation domain-containing protein [bacterium]|nr:prepilin-type N-terminal cleavage/methylation domain-containing protein [bacterium]
MNRRAMTLLEVLLAVSISLVLALGIYQSIVMHFAQAESGRQKAARSQIVRGVLGQMQRDMRNLFTGWQPVSKDAANAGDASDDPNNDSDDEDSPEQKQADRSSDSSSASSSTSSSSSSSSNSSSSVTSATSPYEVPAGGVLGLPDAVTLITRRTPAGLDFRPTALADGSQPPISDLRLVRYWYGSPGVETQDNRIGLVRQEINYIPDVTAGDNPATGARTEILAHEIRGIQIRYFDGTGWLTEWAQSSERPPQAIEVTVALPRDLSIAANNSPSSASAPLNLPAPTGSPAVPLTEGDLEYLRIVVSAQDLPPPEDSNSSGSASSSSSSSTSSGSNSTSIPSAGPSPPGAGPSSSRGSR